MVTSRFRKLAIVTCIGMLIVLLAGALVTNTDSGAGCGTDWPLCNGKFVPAYTVESMIEYSHRFVSGAEGILVLIVTILAFNMYKRDQRVYKEPYAYALAALIFTIIQAIMGAAAVKMPTSAAVMAIHFGISLVAFTATFLLVIWSYRAKDGVPPKFKVPRVIVMPTLLIAIYTYVVVYLGAFIRHTDSAGGCLGWPLCNGEVIPELQGATGIVFLHRVGALILGIVIAGLYWLIKKQVPNREVGLIRSVNWILSLVIVQIFSGALLTMSIGDINWFLFTSLLHNVIIVALFSVIVDLLIRAWRFSK